MKIALPGSTVVLVLVRVIESPVPVVVCSITSTSTAQLRTSTIRMGEYSHFHPLLSRRNAGVWVAHEKSRTG